MAGRTGEMILKELRIAFHYSLVPSLCLFLLGIFGRNGGFVIGLIHSLTVIEIICTEDWDTIDLGFGAILVSFLVNFPLLVVSTSLFTTRFVNFVFGDLVTEAAGVILEKTSIRFASFVGRFFLEYFKMIYSISYFRSWFLGSIFFVFGIAVLIMGMV